jgi:hypothetical protein
MQRLRDLALCRLRPALGQHLRRLKMQRDRRKTLCQRIVDLARDAVALFQRGQRDRLL